jgi:CDP-diacylglycerol--glycerol-3-phosphate 3-phosphatidyltransferase
MNLANKISILRILLVPALIASILYYHPQRDWLRFMALGLFLIGVISDAVDGYIARSQQQQTQLGTLLDPLADKALILGALISCSVVHGLPEWMRIPAWFNLVVISRDAVVVLGSVILFLVLGRWTVRPSRLGKWATGLQMLVIPVVLLQGTPLKLPLLMLAATLTILSGLGYVRAGIRALA